MVGRDNELARLEALVADAYPGFRGILLEGEPGIGKTVLWQAAVEEATLAGNRVLVARPAEAEASVGFAALGDLLADVHEAVGALVAPRRHALRVALLLEEGKVPVEPRALALAVHDLLHELAADNAVIVAIDDVQWLDAATRAALAFALRRLGDEPVRFVATVRSGEVSPNIERVDRLPVEPLDVDGIGRVLRSHLGTPLPRPVVRRLHQVSGGNPFYALELARALLRREEAHAGIESLALPDTLTAAVRERISVLAPEERCALLTVSALSAPTEADVAAVAGAEAVTGAVDAHVLVLEPERVRLVHPLLGSVAYASASVTERRKLHAKLAGIVTNPEDRARHQACAAAGPDETVAAALEEAAHTARARAATDSAVELAEFAVALTPPDDEASRLRRLALAGVCHYAAGDAQRAHELLEQVVVALPAGPDRAQLLWRLGTVKTAIAGPPSAFALYTQALEEAEGDNRLLAQILDRLVVWRWVADGAAQAEGHARALLELAEEVGEPGLLARAVATKLALEVAQGRPLDRQRYARMLALEREDPDQGVELPGNILHHQLLTWAGELDESRARITQLLARARDRGEAAQLLPLWCLGWLDLITSNWQATVESAERGLELAEQIGREAMVHPCLTLRALARAHFGDVEGAVADARIAGEFTTRTGQEIHALGARTALALIDLSRGDTGAAHTAYREIAVAMERRGDRCLGEWWLPDELEARVAEDDVDEAERRLEVFARESERTKYPRFLAQTARCRGLIAFGRGNVDAALAQLDAATTFHGQYDDAYQRGRTLFALGTILRRLGKKARSAETLLEAERCFTVAGAPLWIERATAERGRIGGRATASRGLTETERQIADLVATGLSNAEVAHALSISPRTVEWNLTKIFRKLHVASRTELAAKLAAR